MQRDFYPTVLLAFVSTIAVSGNVMASDPLTERMNREIQSAGYPQAHWGLLVVDVKSGEVVYELDADKMFMPASTTKLFSCAAALDEFGADYRFETPLYGRGEVKDGELNGEVVLVAKGDLTMGGRTDAAGRIAFADDDHIYANFRDVAVLTEQDPLAGLKDLARQVAAKGVRRIRGDVVVDDRFFESAVSTGSGPARVTPIMINDNVIDISITPSAEGKAARVTWRPETSAMVVDAAVETVGAKGETKVQINPAGANGISVRGQIAAGRKTLVRIFEVPDPASFARSLLIEALRREGIVIDASTLTANPHERLPPAGEYDSKYKLATLTSPPFGDAIRLVLKVSHNLHASTLPVLLATRHGERTLGDGLRRQRDFLDRAGVPVKTISFGGGAGGSPSDLVTPRATVALLRSMATRPDFPVYRDALPVLGVDGTLATAVSSNSPAKGKVQAKTGTYVVTNDLNGGLVLTSKALAGYVTTATDRELAFAFFVNHVHLKSVTETQDIGKKLGKLCECVYEASE